MDTQWYSLRGLRRKDIPALIRLRQYCNEPYLEPRTWKYLFTWAEGRAVLAESFLFGYVLFSRKLIDRQLTLLTVMVHPEWRRYGHGTVLISSVIGLAARHGLPIETLVPHGNLSMMRLLESTGFQCAAAKGPSCRYRWEEMDATDNSEMVR